MKIVQLPRKIFVGSYEFPVILAHPSDPRLMHGDGKDAELGEGMSYTGEPDYSIVLANDISPMRRLAVFIHEITHVINWTSDFDEDEAAIIEEDIATAHGEAWAKFYLDNPKYLAWLVYTVGRIKQDRKQTQRETDAPETPKPGTSAASD